MAKGDPKPEKFTPDTIGGRLGIFANATYGSLVAFGKVVGLDSSAMTLYTSNERPNIGAKLLEKFRLAGMRIDWLLSGEGEMRNELAPDYQKHHGMISDDLGLEILGPMSAVQTEHDEYNPHGGLTVQGLYQALKADQDDALRRIENQYQAIIGEIRKLQPSGKR